MANLYGISSYQVKTDDWKKTYSKNVKSTDKKDKTSEASKTSIEAADTSSKNNMKVTDFKPLDNASPLVPSYSTDYGNKIGEVTLSDKAKDYYNKLKATYGNMDFILVSKDMKSQVQNNVAAYGNSNKQVVLIDDEKIEKMANDENYRKKYESIIAMSQLKLTESKNSLASSGAGIKNFGMSVDANGKTSFFATIEKSADNIAKINEKKQKVKQEEKVKEKKAAAKKQQEKQIAKKQEEKQIAKKQEEAKLEEKQAEAAEENSENSVNDEAFVDDKDYVEIKSNSLESLVNKVANYAFGNSSGKVLTDAEKQVGQHFDSKF